MKLIIDNTFNKYLTADKLFNNHARQVLNSFFSYATPRIPNNPQLIHTSIDTASLLGLSIQHTLSDEFLAIFSGKQILSDTKPYAMCYGGYQFGHWAGQLGDGRAINLTEILYNNKRWTLQLKGAGTTPYSRTADGLAVLRSSIREYLCAEAMHHLGIPTTRSLSLVLTGDEVLRDVLYDGNPAYEKGAIVCRVATCFIRFGNFEIFASRGDMANFKTLADYLFKYHFIELESSEKQQYIQLFQAIVDKTKIMVLHWQRVGFVHGVMNTDNMSVLGLTIDYGPYGWLEDYNHYWTPNTTDRELRYCFGNQPNISLWNLSQLANAFNGLIDDTEVLQKILDQFSYDFQADYIQMMREKLGLELVFSEDKALIDQLEKTLQLTETDMTIFFRNLSKISKNTENLLAEVTDSFYKPEELNGNILFMWNDWLQKYAQRLAKETTIDDERKIKMNNVNPKYVLRNYIAQMVIDEAEKGNYALLNEIHQLLKQPYTEQIEHEKWFSKRPEWARNRVGCATLSCSS